jgi:succinate dehydrogenase/fumarate reductase cytochrome b subunit
MSRLVYIARNNNQTIATMNAPLPPASLHRRLDVPRRLHRIAAGVVGVYVLVHLINHLAALGGAARHIAFMQAVRQVTRFPAVEALLLACVMVQSGSGVWMILRRKRQGPARRLLFDRLQVLSGAYLAFFLAVHVISVLAGRTILGLDTNFYFAAAGLNIRPYPLFFAPYYCLAVAALFTHLACVLRRRLPAATPPATRDRLAWTGIATGVVLAILIVAAFSGAFYPVELPPAYRATFS